MQDSLAIISFALLFTITIIMAGGTRTTLQVVDHLSSNLGYPQYNIKSVEASTSETATGTNTTMSNATSTTASPPQSSSIRHLENKSDKYSERVSFGQQKMNNRPVS